jgi:two-component system, OmpR family, response regulator
VDRGGIEPPTFALRTRHYTPKPPALVLVFEVSFYFFSKNNLIQISHENGKKSFLSNIIYRKMLELNKHFPIYDRLINIIMKVLIVDDNQDITGLLSKFLKAKGFENVVTNDPRDGLERIKEEKYDVVLLDISMPEMSGIDIIQTLERERILKDQKIVIFSATAFTTSQINDLLKKEGIQGCLKKPIQLNELLTAITS